ncbi:MAG: hypothetical protein ACE5J3_09660 [Methanosarcinales archaeon]
MQEFTLDWFEQVSHARYTRYLVGPLDDCNSLQIVTHYRVRKYENDTVEYIPTLNIQLKETTGWMEHDFIVDSSASISVASRDLANRLGLKWENGIETVLKGVSNKTECEVLGRIHEVEVIIPKIRLMILLPICFAEGDAPLLLGREVFFDIFYVCFDKYNRRTCFKPTPNLEMLGISF